MAIATTQGWLITTGTIFHHLLLNPPSIWTNRGIENCASLESVDTNAFAGIQAARMYVGAGIPVAIATWTEPF